MTQPNHFRDPLGKAFAVESQQDAFDDFQVFGRTAGDDAVGTQVRAEPKRYQRAFARGRRRRQVCQVCRPNAGTRRPRVSAEQFLQAAVN